MKTTPYIRNFSPRGAQRDFLLVQFLYLGNSTDFKGLTGSVGPTSANDLHTQLIPGNSSLLEPPDMEPHCPEPKGMQNLEGSVDLLKCLRRMYLCVPWRLQFPSISDLIDVIHCCYPKSLQNIQELKLACCNQQTAT